MSTPVEMLAVTQPMRALELPDASPQELLHSAAACVREDLELVERRLRTLVHSRVEGVPEMMAYLIEAGGKRVRPLFTCLLARACGYSGELHIDVASVAELLHTATLYHDDVVDEARLRRGKPTANHLFGNKVIVLAGDLMLANSFSLLMEGGHFAISRALSRTVRDMVEGEILQLRAEENLDACVEDYLLMIRHKTASLFRWCGQAAAMIAGRSPEECRAFGNLGEHVGMAFQLVDDLMDFVGDEENTGKALFKDLREGKITLPVLQVLKHHPDIKAELQLELSHALKTGRDFSPNFLDRLQRLIATGVVHGECKRLVYHSLYEARQGLEKLPVSIFRANLCALIDFLGRRDR